MAHPTGLNGSPDQAWSTACCSSASPTSARSSSRSPRGIALVVWGNRAKGQRHITVGTDSELGGRLGAEHLIACGARRLAFVGDTAGVEIATRLKGARAAAQAAGLTIDHIPADLADERMRSQIGAALIASGADYDGIVAASDVIAMATLHVLHEAGRKVPGDIQLVGFDDLPMAGLTSPR
ncbi:substrate-binding domain-containing protein [Novosphingobium panipatense]